MSSTHISIIRKLIIFFVISKSFNLDNFACVNLIGAYVILRICYEKR